jgi:hypothetical protein
MPLYSFSCGYVLQCHSIRLDGSIHDAQDEKFALDLEEIPQGWEWEGDINVLGRCDVT